jgi:hypothetical protein
MGDTRFTHELAAGLKKAVGFIDGLPTDAADALKIVGTVASDVATIKTQIGSGNYVNIVAGLQSDILTLQDEIAALKQHVVSSLTPASTSTTGTVTPAVSHS